MNANTPKCIVIGLDGATFKIIQPLIEKGKLPYIAALMANGVHGNLKSGIPRISPSIWTSIITGKNPSKHGIYDFVQNDYSNSGFHFNSSANRRAKPIWSILSENGKKVCISGLIMTYPPDKVNGYMVSEIIGDLTRQTELSTEIDYTHPPDLGKEIESNVGNFVLGRKKNTLNGMAQDLLKSAEYRFRVNKYLLGKSESDFQFFYFPETDTISHMGWQFLESKDEKLGHLIFDLYEKIDTYVGELISDANTNVILVSDHGFGELKRVVSLNDILASMGVLRFKSNSEKVQIKEFIRKLVKVKNLLLNKRKPLQGFGLNVFFENVDWASTKAYHFGTSCGTIFINLKNRETKGIVEPEEYDALCSMLITQLEGMVDEKTGQKIIKKIYRKEDIFNGPYMNEGPDLYIEFNDGFGVYIQKSARLADENNGIIDAKNWTGDHDENGIFVAAGPQFKKGCIIEDAGVMDITPTILYLMGVPVSNDMDGKILMDAIDIDFSAKNPPVYSDVSDDEQGVETDIYSGGDNDQIAQRLKDLGYM